MLKIFTSHYCGNRLFEWVTSASLLAMAIQTAVFPDVIGSSNFRYILVIIAPANLSLFLFVVGTVRIAALIANGRYWPKWSPKLRALGALGGALIWFQITVALMIYVSDVGRPPSPGIPVYLALMFGELISCYRVLASDGNGNR